MQALESDVSLSRSILWDRQENYFEAAGAGAFQPGAVPSYVTNHPMWARAAAELTVAYLRDVLVHDASVVRGEPFYVVDAGAGSGRFAYNFVRHLADALQRHDLADLRVVTVLADRPAATRAFWLAHPCLAEHFAAERLDVAAFDARRPGPIRLVKSGRVLTSGTVRNPMVVICNYLVDTLPHDVFGVSDGVVHEHLATTWGGDDEGVVEDVVTTFRAVPTRPPHYGEPTLDALLEDYRGRLEGGSFALPVGGLRLFDELARLTRGRLCALVADKGYRDVDELRRGQAHDLARHGSVSMMVNFDAIARWFAAQSGTALVPRHAQPSIAHCAYAMGCVTPRLAQAFESEVERFGPSDFLALRQVVKRGVADWTLPELMSFWRLSAWCPSFLLYAGDALLDAVPGADAEQRAALREAAIEAWRAYYPVHASDDPSFQLGLIFAELGSLDEAVLMFEHTRALVGDSAAVLYNIAWCHVARGHGDVAAAYLEAALQYDPRHGGALELRARLTHADVVARPA